jgi:CubicO group peptidase (beta-lactamase class C family)
MELQERIVEVLQETKTPGAGVAIVRREGPEWIAGIGLADAAAQRPATPNSLFRIGSISKMFVALSILKLRQEGKLRLDDPVR